ncbi:MAG: TCR/Tet family MFS transporter [Saprospiraceae bacterium]|jgi:DHA1 family tetracycline resistance protein-like MFS transporter|nr:TCR/Tet family MFS transporter [Saprospiraceae bacterium]
MIKKDAAIGFIFATLLLDVIGFGIIIPVLPRLLSEMLGIGINEASKYGGYLLFAFAVAQFIFSPVIGNLSDQYGRRPVLLLSLLGFSIDYLILAFAPDFWWFFIGRIIAGITGASFTTAAAYIADISTPETRSKNFGMIGAAFGLGFIIGPLLGGVLGQFGVKIPFYVAAALSFMNFLYGYFILPESLPLDKRRKFDIKRANPWGSLVHIGKYKNVRYLLLAYFFLYVGSHAVQSTWNYFTMYRFGWSEAMVGYSLAIVGILVASVQAMLAQKSALFFGLERSIVIGFGLYTAGMFLFSIANQSWMLFLFLIPYCFGGIAMPNLQSYMVGKVEPNQQGELQGTLTSLMSITTIIGPIMMTSIFYYFTTGLAPFAFPGIAFFVGGILMGISLIITWKVLLPKAPKWY